MTISKKKIKKIGYQPNKHKNQKFMFERFDKKEISDKFMVLDIFHYYIFERINLNIKNFSYIGLENKTKLCEVIHVSKSKVSIV